MLRTRKETLFSTTRHAVLGQIPTNVTTLGHRAELWDVDHWAKELALQVGTTAM